MPLLYQTAVVNGPQVASLPGSATYAAVTSASVTLNATGNWVIFPLASHTNLTGAGGITISSEVEWRHNTTRQGVSRWCDIFGQFAPSVAAGTSLRGVQVISATNGDTVSMRFRCEDVTASGSGDVEVGDVALVAICLNGLVQGTDYWISDGGNSDSAEATSAGTTWIQGAAAGRIGQGVGEVSFTVPSNGDYAIWASMEIFLNGAPGTTEAHGCRLRRVDVGPSNLGSGIELQVSHPVAQPTAFIGNVVEHDVLTLTSGTQPEIQWEINNETVGVACAMRRSRIFILRLGALANASFITNAGDIQVPSAGIVEGANGLTFNFGISVPVFISASPTFQTGGGNWGRAWLHQDAGDVRYPAGAQGRLNALYDDGVGAGDDIDTMQLHTLQTQTGSVTWRLGEETDSGANTYTLGRNRGNSATARTVLSALHLELASTPGAIAGSATWGFTPVGAVTGLGAILGSSTVAFTPTGVVTGLGAVQGSSTLTFAPSGVVTGQGAILGSAQITFAPTGNITGGSAVQGAATLDFLAAGTLTGLGAVSGSAGLDFACTGDVTSSAGALSGSASISFASAGTVAGLGAVSGSALMSFRASWDTGEEPDDDATLALWRLSSWSPEGWQLSGWRTTT